MDDLQLAQAALTMSADDWQKYVNRLEHESILLRKLAEKTAANAEYHEREAAKSRASGAADLRQLAINESILRMAQRKLAEITALRESLVPSLTEIDGDGIDHAVIDDPDDLPFD